MFYEIPLILAKLSLTLLDIFTITSQIHLKVFRNFLVTFLGKFFIEFYQIINFFLILWKVNSKFWLVLYKICAILYLIHPKLRFPKFT